MLLRSGRRGNPSGHSVELLPANCGNNRGRRSRSYGVRMTEDDRRAAVEAHLEALDAEIARLRQLESAMDRRIEAAEEERRQFTDGAREVADEPDADR